MKPSIIGQPIPRVDGVAKVTGQAKYTADVEQPRTLWGALLRSPVPHARIVSIDLTRARALDGVHAALCGYDIPRVYAGRSLADVPVLAREVVRFIGEPVAAVAAEDRDTAGLALELIDVEYEELPPVLTPRDALLASAPVLHPDFLHYRGAPKEPLPFRNVCAHACEAKGDPNHALAAADVVVTHAYRTPMQHQGYIEPHTCLVWRQPDGAVQVWASCKSPFLLRDELARILALPQERIVVQPTYVGGDFGGKGSAMSIPMAYFLSAHSGRPVRMIYSQIEELTAANPRHGAEITIRNGIARDGRFLARSVDALFDGGAYAGYKPMPGANLAGRYWSAGVYRIPNVGFCSTVAYTNHVPCGHMRAPGGAQVVFATEVDTDRIAEKIGLDPYEFRLRNAVEGGDLGPLGEHWHSIRLKECLNKVRQASGWDAPRLPNVGRGLAVSQCDGGLGGSSAAVQVHSDGRVTLLTGVSDQGSGAHTILLQVVANELQVSFERVSLQLADTRQAPWDSGSSASRVTYVAGQAVLGAIAQVREQLVALAAEYLGCPADRVELVDGVFHDGGQTGSSLSFDELATRAIRPERPLFWEFRFADMHMTDTPSFGAVVAEVEVDRETGALRVQKVTAAFDVGTVLNPIGVTGQLEGGLIQGYGAAVMEELRLNDARVDTTSLADYRLPNALDVPDLSLYLITDAPGKGPYGAKAIGELSHLLLPPAISNAVYHAVGVRISDLPVTAEKVYRALRYSV